MIKAIRVHDGYYWLWESDGVFVRLVRGRRVNGNIEDYAERLIREIQD